MSQAVFEYEENTLSPRDLLAIVKRRRLFLIVPSLIVALLALGITFALPAVYTSEATILIEEQEVPREFVTSTITSFAAQQIQVISQRVLTADSIARIADKFGLYTDPETGTRPPGTQIAEAFRGSMTLDLVSADVIDPRSGQARKATIAFTLAFDHGDPSTAQKVTNELVTLFLDENLRTRTERAANTEAFLAAEAGGLRSELTEIEQRLADFKQANQGALPELYQFNLSTLERTASEINTIDARLNELARRKLELSAELAQLSPWAPVVSSSGNQVMSEQERLKALRAEYRQKAAVYKPSHPDIQRLQREIEQLEAQTGASATREELERALAERERELQDLRQRFQPDSVQVRAAERVVADLLERLSETGPSESEDAAPAADNPAYILLDTQRKAAVAEESALKAKRQRLQAKIENLENLISRAPSVEKNYQALLRDYESAQRKYQEIRAKQREAELAENMEQDRKGERFVMVEPPNLPREPSSPNRQAFALIGLVMAMGAGAGGVMLSETLDPALHGDRQLTRLTGEPPFAVVSYIDNSDDLASRHVWRKRAVFAGVGLAVLAVVFFHIFIKPLDVAWFILMNRLGL